MKKQPRVIARGKVFRVPATVQGAFVGKLETMLASMMREAQKEISDLFYKEFAREHFGSDGVGMDAANIGSQARILVNKLKGKYDQLFGSVASDTSKDMVDGLVRSSTAQGKEQIKTLPGLKERSKEYTIALEKIDAKTKGLINAAASNAADFIKTIPERYLNDVAKAVYNSIVTGNGMQDLIPFFEKHDTGTRNWVRNVAMDQTRKTYNGLNLGRMRGIGISRGEWIHSAGSQKPRELHVDFDGKTFDLQEGAPVGDDDGNMVQPGEEPYCRCTFAPVLTDGDNGLGVAKEDEDEE